MTSIAFKIYLHFLLLIQSVFDNHFIACKSCGWKLSLFETVYYEDYCIDSATRRQVND